MKILSILHTVAGISDFGCVVLSCVWWWGGGGGNQLIGFLKNYVRLFGE